MSIAAVDFEMGLIAAAARLIANSVGNEVIAVLLEAIAGALRNEADEGAEAMH